MKHRQDPAGLGFLGASNYATMLSILLSLPPTLTPLRPFTNREKNAIRRANILRKKTKKKCQKRYT